MNKQQLAESFVAMMKEATKNSPPRIDQLRGKDLFLRYVGLHEKAEATRRMVGDAYIDPTNFLEDYYGMIKCMMHLAFNTAQVETIEWWLYENVEKIIYWPEESREWRLDTPEQLWDYLHATGSKGENSK